MRTREELLNIIQECNEEIQDIEEREFGFEELEALTAKWKELFHDFAKGVAEADLDALDTEHVVEAFVHICSCRLEELYGKADRWREEYEGLLEKNHNMDKTYSDKSEIMEAIKSYCVVLNSFYCSHIGFVVNSCIFRLRNQDAYEALKDIVKRIHNEQDFALSDYASIYDYGEQQKEYKSIPKVMCSYRGIELLEGILGSLPEFDVAKKDWALQHAESVDAKGRHSQFDDIWVSYKKERISGKAKKTRR